ncbi:hypothetical protein JXA59_01715 [Patescibacteria group bacterium]|nr:hypothetical protein [Patescibacteria group bacterium]
MLKPNNKLRNLLIIIGLVAASAGLAWWYLAKPAISGITPPPPVHAYDGENNLKYALRRGSYVQQDETRSFIVNGNTIELQLTFDQNYISPAIGSSVKGTIRLLVNGKVSDVWPAGFNPNEWATDGKNPRVYLTTYGTYSWACPTSQLLYAQANTNSSNPVNYVEYCYPGLDYTAVTNYDRPYVSSAIYSPQASSVLDRFGNTITTQLELIDGKAEFEFIYRSGRYAPYVEFETFASLDQKVYSRKILKFQDQISPNIDTPQVSASAGPLKYDLQFSTTQVEPEQPQIIQVKVTSVDVTTQTIKTDPYQRVRLWTYPLAYYAQYAQINRVLFEWPWLTGGLLEKAGDWLGYSGQVANISTTPEIITSNQIHKALIYPGNQYIELDLINGEATGYFAYNGKYRSVSPQLIFVAQPVSFDFEPIVNPDLNTNPGAGGRGGGAGAESVRYAEELPARPDDELNADGVQIFSRTKQSDYNFLYITWFKSDLLAQTVYSVHSLPIAHGASVALPIAITARMLWLLIAFILLQVTQILIGGFMIFFKSRRKQKIATPTTIKKSWLKRLSGWLLISAMASLLIYSAFNFPGYDLLQTPSEPVIQTLPTPTEKATTKSGHSFVIEFDTDKLNPYPGGVSHGRIRVVDNNNQTVPVQGVAQLTSGFATTNAIDEDSRYLPDYFGELTGREMVTKDVIEQGIWELRTEKDYTEVDKLKEELKHDANAIGEMAKDAGVGGGGEALYAALGKVLEDWADDVVVPVEIKPASYAIKPGCSVIPGGSRIATPFSEIGTCGLALTLRNGEAEFTYINHAQQYGYVTFRVTAVENSVEQLAMYDPANYQTKPGDVAPELILSTPWLLDERTAASAFASLPYTDQATTLTTRQSWAFGDYRDFSPSAELVSTQTKLDYYYQIKTSPSRQGQIIITITPKALPNRVVPYNATNRARLSVAAGFDPTEVSKLKNQWSNSNADNEYVDPPENLGQTYPVRLLTPGNNTPVTELTFDIGNQPIKIQAELTSQANLLPYIGLNMEVWSAKGVPAELKFEDIQRKSLGARSVPTQGGYTLKPVDPSIYRTETPRTMVIKTNLSLDVSKSEWLPSPSRVGQLFVAQQIAGLILILIILIWRRVKIKRNAKQKTTA